MFLCFHAIKLYESIILCFRVIIPFNAYLPDIITVNGQFQLVNIVIWDVILCVMIIAALQETFSQTLKEIYILVVTEFDDFL